MLEGPSVGKRILLKVNGPAGKTSHQGVVIPSAAKAHVTVKLQNGYNVSYPLEMVDSFDEVDDKIASKSLSTVNIEQNTDLPKVTIIHTGGTIASKVDYETGAVIARFEPEELLASVPEILEIANIDSVKIGNMWSDVYGLSIGMQ